MTLTARSYCTGTGALEMAVRQAFRDFELLSHSDIKPAAVALLDHHYPDVPNLGDMKALFPADRDEPCAELEPADLWLGSWPCQPHSSAGKRLGEDDPRDLWPNYLRGIEATRPSVFFGENVARIASNGELRRVVQDLARIGYVGSWRVLGAADVGACHLRKRCFVVAADGASPDTLSLSLSLRNQPGWSGGTGRQGQGVVGHDGTQRSLQRLSLLPTPTQSMTTGAGTSGRDGGLNLQTAVAYLPTPSVADARNTRNATANRSPGQEHHHVGWTLCDVAHADRWGKYAGAITRHEQEFGRPAPEPTSGVTKNGNPQLNPAFVEWMMMLPEGHVTGVPGLARSQQLSLLGDGVVPAQGAAAFSFLLDHLAQRLNSEAAA